MERRRGGGAYQLSSPEKGGAYKREGNYLRGVLIRGRGII